MKKIILWAVLGAGLFLASPAYADITIAAVGPVTGEMAFFGEQMKRGAEQAVADINAHGGINGEKIVLRVMDDACDPKQAVAVANQMASAGVKFIVGHFCSSPAIVASKVYNEEGIFAITPSATNPALTDAGFKTIFRACGRDDQQGSVDANYILEHFHDKKIAIAHNQTAWGEGIARELKKTLNAGGVKEVLFDTFTPGEREYSSFISRLKQARVEVAFLGGFYTEVGLIVRQMKEQDAHMQIIGGDALVTDNFWAITGPAGEGVLMSFGPDPRKQPEAKSVVEAFRKGGYEPEGYTLNTYAAFQAIAEGIKRAGKADPSSVALALHQKPVNTIIGPLAFDAKGDLAGSHFVMYRWHDGKYTETGD